MKLLLLTQAVDLDDPHLNFFHQWLETFAKKCEKLTIICLKKGRYNLPSNVEVLSLGKETGANRLKYIFRLYKYVWFKRHQHDAVFVHMNPEYIVLCGWFWKLYRKKIALWYIHRQVNIKLRIAAKFATIIYSSTKDSFRIPSKKVNFVGHGVNTTLFAYRPKQEYGHIRIITVGRITKIKNCEILIEAAAILKHKFSKHVDVVFVGAPVTYEDHEYEKYLHYLIEQKHVEKNIKFLGMVPNTALAEEYYASDVSVNLTPTGGMDKVVLESYATGTLCLTTNEAFKDLMGTYEKHLLVKYRNPGDLANKVFYVITHKDETITDYFVNKIKDNFTIDGLVGKIIADLLE